MNWNAIKALVALAFLVAGSAAIYIYTERSAEDERVIKDPVSIVIDYETTLMTYSPDSPYIEHHLYPLFFVADSKETVTFVFRNITTSPVTMIPVSRSCAACTHAALAILPDSHPNYRSEQRPSGALLGGPATYIAYDWKEKSLANLSKDNWKEIDFTKKNEFQIPAGKPGAPTYAALKLYINISTGRKDDLAVHMRFLSPSSSVPMDVKYQVAYIGVPAFDVYPRDINLGEFGEQEDKRTFNVYYYSSTIPDAEFAKPLHDTNFKRFLTASEPLKLNEQEREELKNTLIRERFLGNPKSAYRVTFTLNRKDAKSELDLGPIDTNIDFTASSGGPVLSQRVRFRADVRGAIAVQGNVNVIDLGQFSGINGMPEQTKILISERNNLDLEVVKSEMVPKYLKVEVARDTKSADRIQWKLTLSIAPGLALGELPSDSVIVLKEKTSGQIIRIPVKGRGR